MKIDTTGFSDFKYEQRSWNGPDARDFLLPIVPRINGAISEFGSLSGIVDYGERETLTGVFVIEIEFYFLINGCSEMYFYVTQISIEAMRDTGLADYLINQIKETVITAAKEKSQDLKA